VRVISCQDLLSWLFIVGVRSQVQVQGR